MSKFKVGDKVRVRTDLVEGKRYGDLTFWGGLMPRHKGLVSTVKCITEHGEYFLSNGFYWNDEMLEPADSKTLRMADGTVIGEFNTSGFCDGFRGGKIPTPEKPISIEEQLGLPKGVSIHDLDMTSLYRPMNIEIQPLELVCNEEQEKNIAERLAKELNDMLGVSFTKKEEKKMPTKFTFYFNVNEGTRVDKSCNGTIPTITTSVVLDKFGDPDRRKCYSLKGEATCDKADYDMRQGVLEALANAVFDGNFEKAYDKAVKTNAFCERQDRTCHYCGKVLDTIEEKQAHEAWHVERKKARRERYLLRKRAKEIAFEEAAQKMAKEIIAEDNKK